MSGHLGRLGKSCFAISFFIFSLGAVAAPKLAGQEAPPPKASPGQAPPFVRVAKKSGNPASGAPGDPEQETSAANSSTAEGNSGKSLEKPGDPDNRDDVVKRLEWFYKQRSSVNGRLPAGARLKAYEHMQRMMVAEGKMKQRADGTFAQVMPESGTSTPAWTSIGPTPTTGSEFGPVTGRITTIAVDPSDSTGNTVLIGGAQGGIWRTTDGGTTWTAVGDQNASLAMGSIAFAPSQSSTVYAGTGEQAAIGFDVYYGAGVLVSKDHGQTWKQTCTVASTTCPFIGPYDNISPFGYFTLGGTRISYVSVNPNNPSMVLVGAQTQFAEGPTEGVYCSDNSGATWSNILADEMSTFVGFASSSVAYAALGNPFGSSSGATNGNGIYKATGIGSTCATIHFTRVVSANLPLASAIGRIELGIAPSDTTGNTVYASIADANSASQSNLGVYVTTDGGTSWFVSAAPDVCQSQCWYDNVVKVDPNNKLIAFFGGAAVSNGGVPNWVIRTTTGGTSWASVIPNVALPNAGVPHVDEHAMAFVKLPNAKVRMYLGNDGGIWRTDDAEAANVTWTNLNDSTLTLTQFYPDISIHPSSPGIAVGGTQDNGTQTYAGTPSWANVNVCGDGTGTAIDNVVPSTVYIDCNGFNLFASYQNGAPGTFSSAVNGINPSDYSNFVPPLIVDPEQANVLYLGTTTLYQSVDAGNTWTMIQQNLGSSANQEALTALAVAPTNSKALYAGISNGQIFATSDVTAGNGLQVVAGQGLPTRTVTAIAVDPADTTGQTAYAAFSGFSFVSGTIANDPLGHIFKTTNRGTSWVDISCSVANCETPGATDLPNIPVNSLVLDPDAPGTIFAATDLGVFVGNCAAMPCTWSTLGTGLPRVAVLSLKLHEPSRTLRAATHGRGVWDVVLTNSFGTGAHIVSLSPTSANSGANSFTLTVTGSGLTGGTIQFGGTAVTTDGRRHILIRRGSHEPVDCGYAAGDRDDSGQRHQQRADVHRDWRHADADEHCAQQHAGASQSGDECSGYADGDKFCGRQQDLVERSAGRNHRDGEKRDEHFGDFAGGASGSLRKHQRHFGVERSARRRAIHGSYIQGGCSGSRERQFCECDQYYQRDLFGRSRQFRGDHGIQRPHSALRHPVLKRSGEYRRSSERRLQHHLVQVHADLLRKPGGEHPREQLRHHIVDLDRHAGQPGKRSLQRRHQPGNRDPITTAERSSHGGDDLLHPGGFVWSTGSESRRAGRTRNFEFFL